MRFRDLTEGDRCANRAQDAIATARRLCDEAVDWPERRELLALALEYEADAAYFHAQAQHAEPWAWQYPAPKLDRAPDGRLIGHRGVPA